MQDPEDDGSLAQKIDRTIQNFAEIEQSDDRHSRRRLLKAGAAALGLAGVAYLAQPETDTAKAIKAFKTDALQNRITQTKRLLDGYGNPEDGDPRFSHDNSLLIIPAISDSHDFMGRALIAAEAARAGEVNLPGRGTSSRTFVRVASGMPLTLGSNDAGETTVSTGSAPEVIKAPLILYHQDRNRPLVIKLDAHHPLTELGATQIMYFDKDIVFDLKGLGYKQIQDLMQQTSLMGAVVNSISNNELGLEHYPKISFRFSAEQSKEFGNRGLASLATHSLLQPFTSRTLNNKIVSERNLELEIEGGATVQVPQRSVHDGLQGLKIYIERELDKSPDQRRSNLLDKIGAPGTERGSSISRGR